MDADPESLAKTLGYLPLLLWMGVRDWLSLGTLSAAWFAALMCGVVIKRRGSSTRALRLTATVTVGVFLTTIAWLMGPLVLVPTLSSSIATTMTLWVRKGERAAVLVCTSMAMIAPLVLQQLGLVTPFYRFENGALVVLPHAVELTQVPTLLVLTVASLLTVVAPAVSMQLLRNELGDSQRELSLQRWTLEQLAGKGRPSTP